LKENTIGPLDLKTSQKSSEVLINGSGPLSIQPVTNNLCGLPTYTLEVSNDKVNFCSYTNDSTDISLSRAIQINYTSIPWKYMRISITSILGDSGIANFIFSHNE
jgi:hypothetical protein